jgi:hypothetical protein
MSLLSRLAVQAARAYGILSSKSTNVSASYLSVAGGGGGGSAAGGGGGAGGLTSGTATLSTLYTYTIVVGAGGNGGTTGTQTNGSPGVNSSISGTLLTTITATGGGYGGTFSIAGGSGGSGGGGGGRTAAAGGSGTSGQGNAGGASLSGNTGTTGRGGGGGGASAAGATGDASANGGNGSASSISGSSVTYAGGGGGGNYNQASAGSGGTGGGGAGGTGSTSGSATAGAGTAGTANLGGGGGGGGSTANANNALAFGAGANGGSGVVIISYASATPKFVGGTLTTSGGNQIHTFTSSGTLSPLTPVTASYLVVAGGGGAGRTVSGGGGAGGLLTSSTTLYSGATYIVTVGGGGAVGATLGARGTNGGNSSIAGTGLTTITSTGGGGGGADGTGTVAERSGSAGGSGGGAVNVNGVPGAGTSGQGNAGGNGSTNCAGGGGGAGAVGGNGSGNIGGTGGNGLQSSISGTATYYAGGGGGGGYNTASTNAGGLGGGGNGTNDATNSTPGTPNTGGGGGGAGFTGAPAGTSASGGSGVVIISYAGSQVFNGGLVTSSGGNTIHTFTATGALTPLTNNLNNSLRFRSSATANLTRTPATTTNRRTYTWSSWVKRGALPASRMILFIGDDGTVYTYIGFNSSYQLEFYHVPNTSGTEYKYVTSAVFRDPSAWYHVVLAIDTTQATAGNRVKIYVNGVQQTLSVTTGYGDIPQNTDTFINTNNGHTSYGWNRGSSPFDGYATDVNFIDGQALEPYYFGNNDANGVWKPIKYTGMYGLNGFYLPFTQNLTTDYAGQLNGSSQFVSLTPTTAFNFGTNSWTMESNILFTSISGNQIFFNYGYEGGLRCMVIYLAGGNLNLAYSTDGSNNTDTSLGAWTPTLNNWYHLAIVRNAGTIKAYVNGVPLSGTINIGTASIYYPSTSGAFRIGRDSTNYLAGWLSNYRIVNGTAVYTQPFVPPSSALTSITNTALLTFQNATLIDNSPNAFALTNNGSFTIASGNIVWNENIFSDASGNANNWLPNNINYSFYGTTYDAMTDVPTNTSATVANYAVMNPLWTDGSVVIAQGNLNVSGGNYGGFSTLTIPTSSKFYAEFTVTATQGNQGVGILKAANAYSGVISQADMFGSNSVTYYSVNGNKFVLGGGSTAYGSSWGTIGDVIGIAVNTVDNQITFYKNNTSQGVITGLTSGIEWVFSTGNQTSTGGGAWNFGQRPFAYTPPTGFVALNTFNLPTPTILQGNKYMDATLYTGNGSTQVVVNQALFKPDLIWTKTRSISSGTSVVDSVRGLTLLLGTATTSAEVTQSAGVGFTAFNSNGFSLGTDATIGSTNFNGATYVGWQWQAGQGSTSSNTSGSITSTVSVNTTAGFSVVTWTGNGTIGATVGHGLGVAPSMIIVKQRSGTESWATYHISLGATKYLNLNQTIAAATSITRWNNTTPSSTVITFYNDDVTNRSGGTYVAYCWAAIAGFSAFGSYTGNGSADGTFVYTGFRPEFVMVKRSDSSNSWVIEDSSRSPFNVVDDYLAADSSAAESTTSQVNIDFLSNGFKLRSAFDIVNASGGTYIYMAFAENPFKNANAR